LIGQCKFDGNLFCFFLPTHKKEERNPTHIAHIGKAPLPVQNLLREANAETNPDGFRDAKECNLPNPPLLLWYVLHFLLFVKKG